MNYKSIGRFISQILAIEAVFLVPALVLSLVFGEPLARRAYLITIGIVMGLAAILHLLTRGTRTTFFEKEGLVCVGLSWVLMSLTGALPFFLSGEIPSFIDAFFETASGFTTTGSSILTNIEALDRSLLYWRSFTHWLGGMGVLVFLLALLPSQGHAGFTLHLLKAESPGPSVSKLVPQMRKTARILYLIYIAITALDVIFLLIGGMPVFDSFCIAFGTAGTGGFAVTNAGLSGYSPYLQVVTTVFMFLFGVNFSLYYLLLRKDFKSVWKDEELRFYFLTVIAAAGVILLSILPIYHEAGKSTGTAVRDSFFQVNAIITTTGFATADFNLWPTLAKALIVFLTIIGASAGSTGGGMKCARVLLTFKNLSRNIRCMLKPNRVIPVRMNGRVVSEEVLNNLNTYLTAYVLIHLVSFLVICLDGYDLTTSFTAVLTCSNNVGPGLGMVGPTGNFSHFSWLSKLVLTFDMLAGRLEIFPMLVLLSPATWNKK